MMNKKFYIVIATLFVMFQLSVMSGHAATITVINKNNSGAGSLRQAIADAMAGDTINFAANLNGSILLTGTELGITKNLTISGPGANILRLEMKVSNAQRVLHVSGAVVSISGLYVTGGNLQLAINSQAGGSALLVGGQATVFMNNCVIANNQLFYPSSGSQDNGIVQNYGTLTLSNSTVSDNLTGNGVGGIVNYGTLTVTNSTVSGNVVFVDSFGVGGIHNVSGTTNLLNSTIANNGGAGGNPGGVRRDAGSVNVKNTIIATNYLNTGTVFSNDVSGSFDSQGNNLIGNSTGGSGFIASDLLNVNPQLGTLINRGGTTYTHSLLAASPAINAGNNVGATATDQRGVARPQGGTVDIGAYESGVVPASFGKIAFVSQRDGNDEIYSMNPDGTNQTRLTNNAALDNTPRWSPDGTKIAFYSDRDSGFRQIYVMNADGSNQTRLTNNAFLDRYPAWSPDGSKIVFARIRGNVGSPPVNVFDLVVMNPDGTNQTIVTSVANIFIGRPTFSPDGAKIFYDSRTTESSALDVFSINLNGTNSTQITTDGRDDSAADLSPDGNILAFMHDLNGQEAIYGTYLFNLRIDSNQGPTPYPLISPPGNQISFFPSWSPDGSKLAYNTGLITYPTPTQQVIIGGDFYIRDADASNPVLVLDQTINGKSFEADWFGCNTPTGANITAVSGTVSVTFSSVAAPCGTTTAFPIDPTTAGALPGGYSLGPGLPAYEITSTASYAVPITVCIQVPSVTNITTFSGLTLFHSEGGVLVDRTVSRNFATKTICASVNSLSPFVVAQNQSPTAAPANISGQVTRADGTPLDGVVMTLAGSAGVRRAITNSQGFYQFANAETGGFYIVSPRRANYSFAPGERSFSLLANIADATFTGTLVGGGFDNPLDTPEYFVRQHYVDFLGREPDEAGFNFWSDQILECGTDQSCIERRRENVSAAYFLSIEFQQTGGLVDGLYRASYGARPQFAEFMPDTRAVGLGVVVGKDGWQAKLEANKQAFVAAFVNRPTFVGVYGNMDNSLFVDTLISHTGVSFTAGERDALVSSLANGTLTRSDALRSIAENQRFVTAKFNEAFVMMEYFGYLRRDPDESGYAFWLNKLNQFNGNFERAEMVKAFILSGEYRNRFHH